jgi:hypothetical protein
MSIGDYENARKVPAEDIAALLLSKSCHHLVPAAGVGTLLERPGNENVIVLQAEVGDWRLRPGDYVGFTFVTGDITAGVDTIDETDHGYSTGDGPFQITSGDFPTGLAADTDYWVEEVDADTIALHSSQVNAEYLDAELTASTPVTLAAGTTMTRTTGSWRSDGFKVGHEVTLAGSAGDDGIYTVTDVTDLVLTVAETMTGEAERSDLALTVERVDITADGSGNHVFGGPSGWAAAVTPAASTTNGYGSALLGEGATLVMTAPSSLTVVGFGAAPVLTYWWI